MKGTETEDGALMGEERTMEIRSHEGSSVHEHTIHGTPHVGTLPGQVSVFVGMDGRWYRVDLSVHEARKAAHELLCAADEAALPIDR